MNNTKITTSTVNGTAVTGRMLKIVFCRDCKYADTYQHCDLFNFWNRPDDFCSRGERRESGE